MTATRVPTDEGLSAALADTLHGALQGGLPSVVVSSAKLRLLHTIRVSMTSRDLPPAVLAWNAVSADSGSCAVIGRTQRLSGPDAAFVNAVAAHSSLKEDCGPGGLREGSHPGTYVVPAALAAAEMSGASGSDLLRGIIMGYEAVSRLGAASPPGIGQRRFRPVGIMGAFGAAAAAGGVWGLDRTALSRALAIAANMAGGVNQGIFDGTMEPYFHSGIGARNGLLAAQLARAGAITSDRSLEGDFGFFQTYGGAAGSEDLLVGARDDFGVTRVGTKRFAACLQNQETIALITDTVPGGIDVRDIVRVTIRRPATGTNGLESPGVSRIPPYSNMLQAQMSARFTAAAALSGAPVDDATYFRDCFADSGVTALAGRIELENSTDGSVRVEIELIDRVITLDSDVSNTVFPEAAEIRTRFYRDVAAHIGADAAEELLRLVDSIDEDVPVSHLTAALCAPTATAAS
ncbi:hypothetical protein EEB14_18370 [Rhodococcus sp. WS4]|nr:hypothetical protein EEB14_18370 [Rhodococcus sp. WS4]